MHSPEKQVICQISKLEKAGTKIKRQRGKRGIILEGSKLFSLIIIGLFSAIFLLSLYESGDLSWVTNDDIGNCGGENKLSPSDVMQRIYENDSDFQNLTKGNYSGSGGIFNETGKSIAYIRINGWYIHEVTVELQNGTLKNLGPDVSMGELDREADSLNGSVISIYPQITGGEFYMITIDTPNGTVKSIEKVDELPEWTTETVIEEVSEDEP